MGNNSAAVNHDPTLNARLIQKNNDISHYENADQQQYTKYVRIQQSNQDYQSQYFHRWMHRSDEQVKVFYAAPVSSMACMETQFEVVTERIAYRLSHFFLVSIENGLTILKTAYLGFMKMFAVYGAMPITSAMIGFNTKHQVKVWLNQCYAVNCKEVSNEEESQRSMVKNIFSMVYLKKNQSLLWRLLYEEIVTVRRFEEAINVIQKFAMKENISIKHFVVDPFHKTLNKSSFSAIEQLRYLQSQTDENCKSGQIKDIKNRALYGSRIVSKMQLEQIEEVKNNTHKNKKYQNLQIKNLYSLNNVNQNKVKTKSVKKLSAREKILKKIAQSNQKSISPKINFHYISSQNNNKLIVQKIKQQINSQIIIQQKQQLMQKDTKQTQFIKNVPQIKAQKEQQKKQEFKQKQCEQKQVSLFGHQMQQMNKIVSNSSYFIQAKQKIVAEDTIFNQKIKQNSIIQINEQQQISLSNSNNLNIYQESMQFLVESATLSNKSSKEDRKNDQNIETLIIDNYRIQQNPERMIVQYSNNFYLKNSTIIEADIQQQQQSQLASPKLQPARQIQSPDLIKYECQEINNRISNDAPKNNINQEKINQIEVCFQGTFGETDFQKGEDNILRKELLSYRDLSRMLAEQLAL